MSLHESIKKLIFEYSDVLERVKASKNYSNPFRMLVTKEIPNLLKGHMESQNYIIQGSVGKGLWTNVPWIAIFDKRITTSAQKGVYIVYLLNKDSKTLYLTLNQGATNIAQGNHDGKLSFTGIATSSSCKTQKNLEKNAESIRNSIENVPGLQHGIVDTGSPSYNAGCIYYKKYTIDDLPDDDQLYSDLFDFITVYSSYYDWFNKNNCGLKDEGETEMSLVGDQINRIKKYIVSKGFSYESGMIENLYLCLKTKPFVILAGTSGTGKTKLVKLFAEAIGAEYELVSVRPDWSDSSDLFGHTNLQGQYVSGAIIDYIKKACENQDKPYFLCLDEMNLARVEYYFSDYLSLIETRKWNENSIITEPIKLDESASDKFDNLYIPENLYFIGTVNMDETTYPFSKKVLDRANTIEFSDVNLFPDFKDKSEKVDPIDVNNDFLKSKYITLLSDANTSQKKTIEKVCLELQSINETLRSANVHVGYRVRDEIVFYMLNNEEYNLLKYEEALDFEIMQKILPRIQGSGSSIKDLLVELFKKFAGDYSSFTQDQIWKQMDDYLNTKKSKYPKSSEKISYMMRRFEEDGFTSYWL